jgi:hypothetical protein
MILEIVLYFLVLVIFGMVVFKIVYSLYDSIRCKKPLEEVTPLSELKKILGGVQCPRDFYCYKSKYNSLSKEEAIGAKSFLICLEEKLQECTFVISSDNHFWCKCPLRNYIANELNN